MSSHDLQPDQLSTEESGAAGEAKAISQSETWKLIQLCGAFMGSCGSLKKLTVEMLELLPYAGKKYDIDYGEDLAHCSQIHENLVDLSLDLRVTAAALMCNDFSVDEWQKLVDKGKILDVFSPAGIETIHQLINHATQFIADLIAHLKNDVNKNAFILPDGSN
jgi:hypothetical protein